MPTRGLPALGVYDADRVQEAASTADVKNLLHAQLRDPQPQGATATSEGWSTFDQRQSSTFSPALTIARAPPLAKLGMRRVVDPSDRRDRARRAPLCRGLRELPVWHANGVGTCVTAVFARITRAAAHPSDRRHTPTPGSGRREMLLDYLHAIRAANAALRQDTDAVLAEADLAVARARRLRHQSAQHL
jgi:hypothetical protein